MIRGFFIGIFLSSAICFGQYDMQEASDTSNQKTSKIDTYKLKQHIYVGGELSLAFGNQSYLYLGPLAGYEFYKGLSAGVQGVYQLYRYNLGNGSHISSSAYGGGVFMRWRPQKFPYVLLQSEFKVYNTEDYTTVYDGDRVNVPAFMSGIGYAGGFGRTYYHVLLMYDFINDPNMPLPKFFGNFPIYIRYGMVFYLG